MLHLELQPELEAQLTQEAQARGLPLELYVEHIVESRPPASVGDLTTAAEAVAQIRRLRAGVHLDGLRIRDLIVEGRRF